MIENRQRRIVVATAIAFLFAALVASTTQAAAAPIEVAGRVLLENGRPLPEARVLLVEALDPRSSARQEAGGAERAPLAGSTSQADGRFRVPAPGPGLYRVEVEAAGYVPMEIELIPLVANIELPDLTLQTDSGLTVRFEADAPGAGETVTLFAAPARERYDRSPGWRPRSVRSTSATAGPIRLPKATEVALVVSAHATNGAPVQATSVRGRTLSLGSPRSESFRIRVEDHEGQPAAGVSIFAEAIPIELAQTDERGVAQFRLAAKDTPRVALLADDGRETTIDLDALDLSAGADGTSRERVIRLPAMRYVPGKVTDRESRRGLVDALVWDRKSPRHGVRTDSSGGFVYRAPHGSKLELTATAAGYLRASPIDFSLGDDGRPGPTFALAQAASIRGKVLDAEGKPVADAAVRSSVRPESDSFRIEMSGDQPDPETLSRDDGTFAIEGLDPESRYQLAVAATGFARTTETLPELEPGTERDGIVIRLSRGAAVRGRVVDADGAPIGGAALVLSKSKPGGPGGMRMIQRGEDLEPYPGSTDENGQFRLAGLSEGTYELSVRSPGFAEGLRPGIEVAERELELEPVVLEPGETLDGQVVDAAGAPLAGVEIRIAGGGGPVFMLGGPADAGTPAPDAVSDPGGRFSLFDLAPGRAVDLTFRKPSYIGRSVKGVAVPQLEPLVAAMKPASTVSGIVLDESGEVIPGAGVTIRRMKTIEMGNMVMQTVAMEGTDADAAGRFVFRDQEPGSITLIAKAPRFREAERSDLTIPEGRDLEGVRIPLERGAIVEGRVLKPDGRPAVGAEVRKIEEGGGGPMRMVMQGNKTDGNGYFRLEGLVADRVSIEALHKDFPRAVKDADLKVGINGLDLRFEGGQRVAGRVLDPNGKPVAAAGVRLATSRHRFGGPSTVTGGDGRFEFEGVEDGSYRVGVDAERFAGTEVDTDIGVAGAPVEGLELRVVPGGAVRGRLSGIEPEKFGEVAVRAEGERYFSMSGAPVNAQGDYRLDRLQPGEYEVVATYEPTGLQAKGTVRLDPGVEQVRLDLRFTPGIELSGSVTEDAEPIAGATVSVRHLDEEHSAWAQSDRAGRFRLEGLRQGRYKVQVQHWETGMNHSEEVELATSREIEIEVPTGILQGLIVDAADRQPLGGVTVSLDPQGEARGFAAQRVGTSDVEGRFRLNNVGDGSWKMVLEKEGYAAVRRDVEVQFEKSRDPLRLSMEPTEGLSLKVLLPGGGIPPSVSLAVVDASGEHVAQGSYSTGEGGSVRVSTVPAGDWTVIVAGSGSADTASAARSPGAELGVVLQPATRALVRVPDLEREPARAEVRVFAADGTPYYRLGWNGRAQSKFGMEAGLLDLTTLPPGRWRFVVQAADGRSWEGAGTTDPGRPAELTLE